MPAERIANVLGVHLEQGPIARAAGRDQHMVHRAGYTVEKRTELSRVVRVEGRRLSRADVVGGGPQALGVASGQDHIGALGAGSAGGLQSDAGATTDQDNGLPGQISGHQCSVPQARNCGA